MSSRENIRVIIRFRPVNKREKREEKTKKLKDVPISFTNEESYGTMKIASSADVDPLTFTFDRILAPNMNQENAFYEIAESLCNHVLMGYNCTLFVFGQTGSGKTYTMYGPEDDPTHPENMGVIPRAVSYIFADIEDDPGVIESRVKVSFLEIYKEKLRDLLNPAKKDLRIRLTPNGATWVSNLTDAPVTSLLDVLHLIGVATGYRTRAETNMNATSSRSHMLMTMTVTLRMDDGSAKIGKVHFADLAGSEKVRKSNATGDRLEEAKKINLSLTMLGQVISALAEGRKHVPFRDSMLTHVLKDSLGGNCKTTLVVAATPHIFNRDETINALRFGMRCKLITTTAEVNRIYSNAELMALVARLKDENSRLRDAIKSGSIAGVADLFKGSGPVVGLKSRQKSGKFITNADLGSWDEEKDKLMTQIDKLNQQNRTLNDQVVDYQNKMAQENSMRNDIIEKMSILKKTQHKTSQMLSIQADEAETTTEELAKLEGQVKHFRQENDRLQMQNEEFAKEVHLIRAEKHMATEELRSKLKKYRAKNKSVASQAGALNQQLEGIEMQLDTTDAQLKETENKLDSKLAVIAMKHAEIKQKDKEIALLHQQMANSEKLIQEEKQKQKDQFKITEEVRCDMEIMESDYEEQLEALRTELDRRTEKFNVEKHQMEKRVKQREMLHATMSLRAQSFQGGEQPSLGGQRSNSSTQSGPMVPRSNTYKFTKMDSGLAGKGMLSLIGGQHSKPNIFRSSISSATSSASVSSPKASKKKKKGKSKKSKDKKADKKEESKKEDSNPRDRKPSLADVASDAPFDFADMKDVDNDTSHSDASALGEDDSDAVHPVFTITTAGDVTEQEDLLVKQQTYLETVMKTHRTQRCMAAGDTAQLRDIEENMQEPLMVRQNSTAYTASIRKKNCLKEISEVQTKLDRLQQHELPEDEFERLEALMEIASCQDDLHQLRKKYKKLMQTKKHAPGIPEESPGAQLTESEEKFLGIEEEQTHEAFNSLVDISMSVNLEFTKLVKDDSVREEKETQGSRDASGSFFGRMGRKKSKRKKDKKANDDSSLILRFGSKRK